MLLNQDLYQTLTMLLTPHNPILLTFLAVVAGGAGVAHCASSSCSCAISASAAARIFSSSVSERSVSWWAPR